MHLQLTIEKTQNTPPNHFLTKVNEIGKTAR